MTLIELIVVMALLSTMFALAAPKMSGFFRGRALTEEARRFVALTKFARSEAAARSVPMELWLEPELGVYGLRAKIEFEEARMAPTEFALAETLAFDVGDWPLDELGQATITFLPDGTLDEESLPSLVIAQEEHRAVEIKQAAHGLGYYAEAVGDDSQRP